MQADSPPNPRCPAICFSDKEILSFYKTWSKALVVKVLEKDFSFPVIKQRLESIWARAGHIQVLDMENHFFLVRFSVEDDYQHALFGGTWKVAVELIGNHIGKTIRLDLATAEGARARYARVCVEIDLSKPLLGKYSIEDTVYYVEYEPLDNICYSCGLYRHKEEGCLPTKDKEPSIPVREEIPATDSSQVEGDSGSWMIVRRRQWKNQGKKSVEPPKDVTSGSRFDILKYGGKKKDHVQDEVVRAESAVASKSNDMAELAKGLKKVFDNALSDHSNSGRKKDRAKKPPNKGTP
ncbi:hypothetical protein LINPERHAP2_LOCUS38500 [Linum perenne]